MKESIFLYYSLRNDVLFLMDMYPEDNTRPVEKVLFA